ncbi:hypothetical protein SCARR_04091 [Pontiella sulfatireligans]|uniref:Uncharacterized protein n=1 Tax=Pontiella sulfatireligans TaxID=2750658 RepID=A0A6C2UNZ0_9BACT|nr:hypothetical protein SCARR_04091 [Pontiella sulfatireligans]
MNLRKKFLTHLDAKELQLLNQIPEIHIKNGTVLFDQKQPYYIRRADGSPMAIIDTTGSMNYIDDEANMLLTETKLIVRRGAKYFNTLDLAQVEEFTINKFIISNWLQTSKQTIAPVSYGLFLMLSCIFFCCCWPLSGWWFRRHPRIATAAVTPAEILITVSCAAGIAAPNISYLLLSTLYLLIGILSCKGTSAKQDKLNKPNLLAVLEEDLHEDAHSHAT